MSRILILTDTHGVLTQSKTRINFVEETINLFRDITYKIVPEVKPDIIIHMGDLFDRGFDTLPTTKYTELLQILQDLKQSVSDNLFLMLGNHEYTYSKNNPAFAMTKIIDKKVKEIYSTREKLDYTIPIFQSPSNLDFGHTKIFLQHYDPEKRYKIPPQSANTICLFHDDLVSFESKQELYHHRLGHGINITNTDIFENVDLAILAHIHTPLQDIEITSNITNKTTTLVTPGSLVNRTTAEVHTKVNLPIIDITESYYTKSYYTYHLPKRSEIFNQEEVQQQQESRQLTKLINEVKHKTQHNNFFNDMLSSLSNPAIETIIRNADTLQPTPTIIKIKKYLEETYKN